MYNYFFVIVIALLLCNCVIAGVIPKDSEREAKILRYDYKNFGEGKYEFSYVTSNGITRNETGQLVNVGQDNEHIVVQGSYSYTDPKGDTRLFQYTADENGYKVQFMELLDIRVGENEDFPSVVQAAPVAPHLASLLG